MNNKSIELLTIQFLLLVLTKHRLKVSKAMYISVQFQSIATHVCFALRNLPNNDRVGHHKLKVLINREFRVE